MVWVASLPEDGAVKSKLYYFPTTTKYNEFFKDSKASSIRGRKDGISLKQGFIGWRL